MPERKKVREGILRGMYKYRSSRENEHHLNLLGSGAILNEALAAADRLKKEFGIGADVWSVTSYKQLYDQARQVERDNRINPGRARKTYIEEVVGNGDGIFVAATDYLKALPLAVANWFPGSFTALGTDGFGLSEDRRRLREYFEVNADHIVWASLKALHRNGKIDDRLLKKARESLRINENKKHPGSC